MTRKNYFWKGIFLGAIAGGAISLLDRETRETMKENVQKVSGKVSYLVQNRAEIVNQMKDTVAKLKSTFEQVNEDVAFIMDKVEDLRELTPKVTDAIKDTKESFTPTADSERMNEKEYH
ncbi:YtxH domain-containing protein [Neobacillus thermocopriae]|uniref:YtxH domain-containing protein n=1 Tax=Neobacillus thermocopriae TaxID=1215031 RepID=UPI002E216EA5|nr:YtxH domain-containing protein [Neobacillus thermocopriae]MED3715093.1 YtxH domain-containing protein [Neobacillus thermocopriae]